MPGANEGQQREEIRVKPVKRQGKKNMNGRHGKEALRELESLSDSRRCIPYKDPNAQPGINDNLYPLFKCLVVEPIAVVTE